VLGILLFAKFTVGILYNTNQPPVLQAINLPEAKGKISSWNQFVETIGEGLGPTLASILLIVTLNNFLFTALILFLIAIPGAILWVFAKRNIHRDIEKVASILSERGEKLSIKVH